jgi:hypothetical protein
MEPFHRLGRELEGHRSNGSIYDIFPAFDNLLKHLETCKTTYAYNSFIMQSIELAWNKLEKYYILADDNIILLVSIALHPGMKFDYFNVSWSHKPQWIRSTEQKVQKYWRDFKMRMTSKRTTLSTTMASQSNLQEAQHHGEQSATTSAGLSRWKLKRKATDSIKDEFEEYIGQAATDSELDPIRWWHNHVQDFPILSKLAFDVFGVPAMSTECERLFSKAGS